MNKKDKIKVIITKIGLDTHTTGANLVTRILREAGMEVVYLGTYQTPEMIVKSALQEDANVIGISCLSANYKLIFKVVSQLKANNMNDILVIAGGTIPPQHALQLEKGGVDKVFPPNSNSESIVNYIVSHVRKGRD